MLNPIAAAKREVREHRPAAVLASDDVIEHVPKPHSGIQYAAVLASISGNPLNVGFNAFSHDPSRGGTAPRERYSGL